MTLSETTSGKLISLFIGLSLYLAEGINYAQLAPFFPTEAHNRKDVSITMIGLITGVFDVANVIGCFILASFASKETQKFFFCAGAFITASCCALFGVMGYSVGGYPFITVCILTRLLMGAGASMVWSTGFPILVPLYPLWAGRITSLVEAFVGLGSMIGPSLGSALYSIGGYATPFIAAGVAEMVLAMMAVAFLPTGRKSEPEQDEESDRSQVCQLQPDDGYTFWYFVKRPEVLLMTSQTIFICAGGGFLEVAVGRYLEATFGVGGDTSGYYFLSKSVAYLLATPVYGWLVDRGHSGRTFILSGWITGISFSMLWLPNEIPALESKIWLVFWMTIIGFAHCGGFVPTYLLCEKMAFSLGFQDVNQVKLMTSSWLTSCYSLGRMLGPIVIGGLFQDYFGYYYASLLQGSLTLVAALCSTYTCFKLGFFKRVHYPDQDKSSKHLKSSFEFSEEEKTMAFRSYDTTD